MYITNFNKAATNDCYLWDEYSLIWDNLHFLDQFYLTLKLFLHSWNQPFLFFCNLITDPQVKNLGFLAESYLSLFQVEISIKRMPLKKNFRGRRAGEGWMLEKEVSGEFHYWKVGFFQWDVKKKGTSSRSASRLFWLKKLVKWNLCLRK